jgi:hypothetical protein
MLRGLIVRLFALCMFSAATAAADQTPNCIPPIPHDGRAESAAVTFSVLRADGTPAGQDTVWQPIGGTVGFSLKGNGLADKPPIVCFAYHGGAFQPSPRVWLQNNDTATNTLVYNATVPSMARPLQHNFSTAARTGIVALPARIRVIVPDGKGGTLTDVMEPIGITSSIVSAILALIAMLLAGWFATRVAKSLSVPGRALRRVISTRGGVASLSQLQVILWTFVIGTGAVYVMADANGGDICKIGRVQRFDALDRRSQTLASYGGYPMVIYWWTATKFPMSVEEEVHNRLWRHRVRVAPRYGARELFRFPPQTGLGSRRNVQGSC